jgi:hypothetical protein
MAEMTKQLFEVLESLIANTEESIRLQKQLIELLKNKSLRPKKNGHS